MSNLRNVFAHGKKTFIAYLMGGDPDIGQTKSYIRALAAGGADLVEIGIPFSDPVAENEEIRQASHRALASKTRVNDLFLMAAALKKEASVPLMFMTYLNPVMQYGYDSFFRSCATSGISGVLIHDLPFEEQDEVKEHTAKYSVELVTPLAPTSGERIARMARSAEGFLYLTSSPGVAGAGVTTDIPGMLREIRKHTDIPVAAELSDPEQAKTLSVDGVIAGNEIVTMIGDGSTGGVEERLTAYVRSAKAAMA